MSYRLDDYEIEQVFVPYMKSFWFSYPMFSVIVVLAHMIILSFGFIADMGTNAQRSSETYIQQNIPEARQESYRRAMRQSRISGVVWFIATIAGIALLLQMKKLVHWLLRKGFYTCKVGFYGGTNYWRGKRSIYLLEDGTLDRAFRRPLNREHYDQALPNDELLALTVLGVTRVIVRRLL